jgi:hypothetical protein
MVNGGWGQVYMGNYLDSEGRGLNGSFHYSLTVPGDVPIAETFWTVTVYNVDNRAIINNESGRADVGSNVEGARGPQLDPLQHHLFDAGGLSSGWLEFTGQWRAT